MGAGKARGVVAVLLAACEVTAASDDILPADIGGPELAACVAAEAVFFRAELEPAVAEGEVDLACTLTDRRGAVGAGALELQCGEATMRVHVEAAPAPTGDGFVVGQALRVRAIRATNAGGGSDVWLRMESASGQLLLAAALAQQVDPPVGGGWAAPFTWREAPGSCMSEETGCGALQRGALGLQLSGGEPEHLVDGTSAWVGDGDGYVAYVEAARVAPAGSGCRPEFALGLLAAR